MCVVRPFLTLSQFLASIGIRFESGTHACVLDQVYPEGGQREGGPSETLWHPEVGPGSEQESTHETPSEELWMDTAHVNWSKTHETITYLCFHPHFLSFFLSFFLSSFSLSVSILSVSLPSSSSPFSPSPHGFYAAHSACPGCVLFCVQPATGVKLVWQADEKQRGGVFVRLSKSIVTLNCHGLVLLCKASLTSSFTVNVLQSLPARL